MTGANVIYKGKHEGYTWHVEAYRGKYAFILDEGCQHLEKNFGEGYDTPELARDAVLTYCATYGWQFYGKKGIYNILIRHWAGAEWGFSVECGGVHRKSGFKSREEAISRAFQVIEEKDKEFKIQIL